LCVSIIIFFVLLPSLTNPPKEIEAHHVFESLGPHQAHNISTLIFKHFVFSNY
jgi:hypothetical protein